MTIIKIEAMTITKGGEYDDNYKERVTITITMTMTITKSVEYDDNYKD